jgi:hypothetical protein
MRIPSTRVLQLLAILEGNKVEKDPTKLCCGNCMAFVGIKTHPDQGNCHAQPPQAFAIPTRVQVQGPNAPQIVSAWPPVPYDSEDGHAFCMMFKPNQAMAQALIDKKAALN